MFGEAEAFGGEGSCLEPRRSVKRVRKSLDWCDRCRREARWTSAKAEVGELLAEAETDLGWAARQEGRLSESEISGGSRHKTFGATNEHE